MKDARFLEVDAIVRQFDTLADTAFLAALAERGVSTSDLDAYAKEAEKQKRVAQRAKQARRR